MSLLTCGEIHGAKVRRWGQIAKTFCSKFMNLEQNALKSSVLWGCGYASTSFLAMFWYTDGERPTIFLKTLMNVVGDLKPTLSAMPLTVRLP